MVALVCVGKNSCNNFVTKVQIIIYLLLLYI